VSGPETPRTHGFCDALLEVRAGREHVFTSCDLPIGHEGEHQALVVEMSNEESDDER
jgi:hypothetical protein